MPGFALGEAINNNDAAGNVVRENFAQGAQRKGALRQAQHLLSSARPVRNYSSGLGILVAFLLPLFVAARELIRVLKQDGWIEKSQKGSHLQLVHAKKKGKITVPVHGGDIPKGTLHAILRQTGLK